MAPDASSHPGYARMRRRGAPAPALPAVRRGMTAIIPLPEGSVHLHAMNTRLMERWWAEHAELDDLVQLIRMELGRGAVSSAAVSVDRLALTLEQHFATEEDLYFPLVERISPTTARLLEGARAAHRKLRKNAEDLLVLIENADVAAARRALGQLLHHLHEHEGEEVSLIAELHRLSSEPRATDRNLH